MPDTSNPVAPTTAPPTSTHARTPRHHGPVKASRLPPLDWAAPHGPITGALSITSGAAALALAGTAAGMPHPVPLLLGGAGALVHGIGGALRQRLTGASVLTRAGTWLAAGGWGTWAMAHGPLSWAAVTGLATLGVGVAVAASHTAVHEEAAEQERVTAHEREQEREHNAERTAVALAWEARIRAVTGIDVHVFAVQEWPNGNGFSLAAELPANATWDRIRSSARALAAAARLPLGCAIHVEEGDVQGRVVLDIPTMDVFGAVHDYPEDFTPLSLLTGIPWGLSPIGDPISVLLREACALILGPPGSGKSTFLDVVLTGFARCTDVLTWVIDFKAGAVGMPWVRPWLEATGRKHARDGQDAPAGTLPGIDWLASTPSEALKMLTVALALGAARQVGYQDLMDQHDTSLLPISARIPQIMIVIDEGAELLSYANYHDRTMRQLQDDLRKLIRTLRAMGIRVVLTAVDGNVSAIGDTSINKFSPVGVALTSGESSGNNLGKLFPGAKVDTSQLTAKGAGVIGAATSDGFAPTPFKGWRTTPSSVRRAILATNHLRQATRLDAHLLPDALREVYQQRWSEPRAGWMWQNTTTPAPHGGPQDARPAPGTLPGGLNLSYQRNHAEPSEPRDTTPAPATPDADALAEELMRELDAKFGTTDEPPTLQPRLNLSYQRNQNPDPDGPDWLTAALDAIRGAGPDGLKPSAVADLVGKDRKTVRAALQAATDRGALVYRDNGPHSVYIHPDHT